MQENQLYVTTRDELRSWLKDNHARVKEVWLLFYKKYTGKPSIPYDETVEEALCFGWIDSIVNYLLYFLISLPILYKTS